jgi:hypothetical protein
MTDPVLKRISDLPGAALPLVGTEMVPLVQAGADVRASLSSLLSALPASVHTVGNETVAGIKTFTSPPVVPAPTASGQAANRGYVDAQIIRVHGARYADVTDYVDPNESVPARSGIEAAYNSLTAGGKLRIPGRTYLCVDGLVLSGNRRVTIDSDGTSSILLFNAAAPLTDGLRIVDAGEFSLNGLRVRNATGSATIENLVHYTTTASSQMCALRDLIIDPQATGITNKLAIGHDTFLDVAEVLLENVYCSGLASTGAAVVAGNHTAGNVINIRALSCFFGNAVYGVLIDGSVIQLTDCTLQGNSGADYKVITPGGAPIKIEGVRSEGSKRFFEYIENGQILGPLSLRDIRVDSFTDADGHIVWIAGLAVTTLEGWTVFGGPVAADFLITSPIAGAVVHARAILTQTNAPFPSNANVTVAWDTPHRYIDSGGLIAVAP